MAHGVTADVHELRNGSAVKAHLELGQLTFSRTSRGQQHSRIINMHNMDLSSSNGSHRVQYNLFKEAEKYITYY